MPYRCYQATIAHLEFRGGSYQSRTLLCARHCTSNVTIVETVFTVCSETIQRNRQEPDTRDTRDGSLDSFFKFFFGIFLIFFFSVRRTTFVNFETGIMLIK